MSKVGSRLNAEFGVSYGARALYDAHATETGTQVNVESHIYDAYSNVSSSGLIAAHTIAAVADSNRAEIEIA